MNLKTHLFSICFFLLTLTGCATSPPTNVPEEATSDQYGKIEIHQPPRKIYTLIAKGWGGEIQEVYDIGNKQGFKYDQIRVDPLTEVKFLPGDYKVSVKCMKDGFAGNFYGYASTFVTVSAGKSSILKCSSFKSDEKGPFGLKIEKVKVEVSETKTISK